MTRRKDPFIWHFAKRGHELEFAKALLQSMRAKESHCIHELHTFSCVAFVLDSTSEPPAQTEKVDVRSVEVSYAAEHCRYPSGIQLLLASLQSRPRKRAHPAHMRRRAWHPS